MSRSLILPFAIVFGLLFNRWCGYLVSFVPYLIFSILFLNFTAVQIKKLGIIHISKLNGLIMLFQAVTSLGCYLFVKLLFNNDIIAEGILIGVLCPVAASSAVVACYLGANRETITSYIILGNLMVAVLAPIYFSFIGIHQDMPFIESFLLILKRVSPVIAAPFFIVLALQKWYPAANDYLSRYKGITLHLWAAALAITIGQTINFIINHGRENISSIIVLGILSVIFCAVQFGLGKKLGAIYGDKVAGGQAMGQKNSSLGIWMANIYLNPLASVFPALYSIWQNLFNSWQMYVHGKELKQQSSCPSQAGSAE